MERNIGSFILLLDANEGGPAYIFVFVGLFQRYVNHSLLFVTVGELMLLLFCIAACKLMYE